MRHQKEFEEDEKTNANVITVLCNECGANASAFIQDYLEDFFPKWDNRADLIKEKYEPILDEEGNQKTNEVGYPLYKLKEEYKEEKENDLSTTSD